MRDDIEALALDVDIGSREGISPDYAARIRFQFLAEQTRTLVRQTQFADTKASAVLALVGLVGARLAVEPGTAFADPVSTGLFALKGVVIGLCFFVLLPRYPAGRARAAIARTERFSWVALSAPRIDPDGFAAFARGAEISQLLVSMARSNAVMARILLRKFRYLRAAFVLAILDLALTFAEVFGAFGRLAAAIVAP